MRIGNTFSPLCLSVQAITIELLTGWSSFWVCRYILTISRSNLSIKVKVKFKWVKCHILPNLYFCMLVFTEACFKDRGHPRSRSRLLNTKIKWKEINFLSVVNVLWSRCYGGLYAFDWKAFQFCVGKGIFKYLTLVEDRQLVNFTWLLSSYWLHSSKTVLKKKPTFCNIIMTFYPM